MRIGTRGSALALAQAAAVADLLGGAEIVPITTSGDRGERGGDKSRWVAELEQALAGGEIDLAVHSAKDLPGELAEGMALLGTPARAPAQDVLCGARALTELPPQACVGTSSLRRRAQLQAARDDLRVLELRGNVDTRLRKLEQHEQGLAAIVLALAGLERLGSAARAGAVLDPARFVPAPGQGALALEGRADDAAAGAAVAAITDPATMSCLLAERALARGLDASCHTPLGAHAVAGADADGQLLLRAWVGLPDGSAWVADELAGELEQPESLGRDVAARLTAVGARELLARAEQIGAVSGV
jgi:hydroxymethylbilane synthase